MVTGRCEGSGYDTVRVGGYGYRWIRGPGVTVLVAIGTSLRLDGSGYGHRVESVVTELELERFRRY